MQGIEDWDDVRYFLAVARAGTLAAAARQLDVNSSTVLRRVANLEEALSARLFERDVRGYALTALGEQMVDVAVHMEDDALRINRLVAGADEELSGTVLVTTVDEILERFAPHLRCFHERYPKIVLDVATDVRLFRLSKGEADVAIRPGQKPVEPDIVGRDLVKIETAAYASSVYLSATKRPRCPRDLNRHCIIDWQLRRQPASTSRWLGKVAPDAKVVYRANSMVGQKVAAVAGLGVAILPRFLGDLEPGLTRLFATPKAQDHHLWLLFHADLRQTARVRTFIDFITEAVIAERALYEGKA